MGHADVDRRAQGYGNDGYDDYASDGAGYGYQGGDGYGGYPQPEQGQYGQHDAYGPPAALRRGPAATTSRRPTYGYQGPDDPYGQPGQFGQPEPGYGRARRRPGLPGAERRLRPAGRLPGRGTRSGATPRLPDGSDGYQGRDAGNDWYGGQPAAASGASFADTGTYALNGRIIEEYGTGPNETMHNPARGYPPAPGQPQGPGQLPGRAQLPAPAQPVISGPQAVPTTGAQERYDDYDSYPGYGGEQYQDQSGRQTGEYPAGSNPTGGYPATGRNPTGELPHDARRTDRRVPRHRRHLHRRLPRRRPQPDRRVPHHRAQPQRRLPRRRPQPDRRVPDDRGQLQRRLPRRRPQPDRRVPHDRCGNPSGGYPAAAGDGYDAYGPTPTGRILDYDDHGNPAAGYDDYATDDPYQDPYGDGAGGRGAGTGGRGKPKKGAAEEGAAGRPRQASPGGRRSRLLPLALGTVFVVVVACAAAYFLVLKPHSSTPNPDAGGRLPTAGASPSNQACVQQYGTVLPYRGSHPRPGPADAGRALPAGGQQRGQRRAHHQLVHPGDDQAGHDVLKRGDRADPDHRAQGRRVHPGAARELPIG